ncbi:hypothetical protein LWI29_006139 [Acer saccharum]|uniref:Uncharacterized protein n=1 Tax=Acer saccharum TaxID=4024 RepID=A0AA39VN09_ACESA|nr:hypothetical protein LWI29_006139 [Acer saccharum]
MLARVAKAQKSPIQTQKQAPAPSLVKPLIMASSSLSPPPFVSTRQQSRMEQEKEIVAMATPADQPSGSRRRSGVEDS